MSTYPISGGRAGAGSAVVVDDATPRTVNVAGVGVVKTGTAGGGVGGATDTRVVILA